MRLVERWRRPVRVLEVRTHDTEVIHLPDGREHRAAVLTLDQESIDRIRSGYVCAKCLEPFPQPWPERCHVCGVSVRRDQAAYFAREFDPTTVDLSATDWEAELDSLEERRLNEKEKP